MITVRCNECDLVMPTKEDYVCCHKCYMAAAQSGYSKSMVEILNLYDKIGNSEAILFEMGITCGEITTPIVDMSGGQQ